MKSQDVTDQMKTFNELYEVIIFSVCYAIGLYRIFYNFQYSHFHVEWSSETVKKIQGKHYSQRVFLGI